MTTYETKMEKELDLTAKGNVLKINRSTIHDGPGIRTTVFMKGCPLRCLWCQNPESWSYAPVLMFEEKLCTSCGNCVKACPQECHVLTGDRHHIHRETCIKCGKCVDVCPTEALTLAGEELTLDYVFSIIKKDKEYFKMSGGGLTISGGEPLLQPDFVTMLADTCRREGIHTAVDTCGYSNSETFARFLRTFDLFLFDLKAISDELHINLTQVSNKQILQNLETAVNQGNDIIIRIPVVPNCNDSTEELLKIAEYISTLSKTIKVQLMKYHAYAIHKYQALDIEYKLDDHLTDLSEKAVGRAKSILAAKDINLLEDI